MMRTLPHDQTTSAGVSGSGGNARFSSIDVNFKRQIDRLRQDRANSSLPATMMGDPARQHTGRGGYNDSIYTQDVNGSMNSGFGLTPKRLQAAEMRKPTAPFQHHSVTDHKNYQRRVPPILLDNANNKKYMGGATMGGGHHHTAFKSPNNVSPGGRFGTAGAGNSFLSREAGSTNYSHAEDSIFQQSEASMSQ